MLTCCLFSSQNNRKIAMFRQLSSFAAWECCLASAKFLTNFSLVLLIKACSFDVKGSRSVLQAKVKLGGLIYPRSLNIEHVFFRFLFSKISATPLSRWWGHSDASGRISVRIQQSEEVFLLLSPLHIHACSKCDLLHSQVRYTPRKMCPCITWVREPGHIRYGERTRTRWSGYRPKSGWIWRRSLIDDLYAAMCFFSCGNPPNIFRLPYTVIYKKLL